MEILGVTRTSLEYLREKIIIGELKAGQRLNEIELSAKLGISRPPLREAFRILEEEQLVVSVPRKGTSVSEISFGAFVELFQAREMIECYCIDLIEEKNIRTFLEIERAVEESVGLPVPPDDRPKEKLTFLKALTEFHIRLVEISENRQLISFYTRIGFNIARYQYMYADLAGLTERSPSAHRQVLNHLKNGQYALAKDLVRYHIRAFVRLMKTRMQS
jgi:DNA-binding GntR family transcriptional regulator